MNSQIPPWEPIADWLARLPQKTDDGTDDRATTSTKSQVRKRYEMQAKAIAYDLAAANGNGETPDSNHQSFDGP